MQPKRVNLIHHDVVRELCGACGSERFHFVPVGAAPEPGECTLCGKTRRIADVTDTSVYRLFTKPDGEVVVIPVIA